MHPAVAEALYTHPDCPCLLLVHPAIGMLQKTANNLVLERGWQRLSVGRELSARMLSEPLPSHSRIARSWLGKAVVPTSSGRLVVTDIDLLFQPSWKLDPLELFRSVSRTSRLVVAWPGTYQANTLAYAVPEHSDYRTWSDPRVELVCLT